MFLTGFLERPPVLAVAVAGRRPPPPPSEAPAPFLSTQVTEATANTGHSKFDIVINGSYFYRRVNSTSFPSQGKLK